MILHMLAGHNFFIFMIPDYDFTLIFPADKRRNVIDVLRPLCDPQSAKQLDGAKLVNGRVELGLTLRALPDMPVNILQGYSELAGGGRGIGLIYLTIEECGHEAFPDAVTFRIWPCTRPLQRACFGSMLLRSKLVEILKTCGGHLGLILYESCVPTEFWNCTTGRSNDQHPPEYAPQ